MATEKKDKEVLVIEKKMQPVLAEATKLEVKDAKGMMVATELLSKLNKFNDAIVAEREKVTKPLNEALKAERARWKPTESANEEAIDIVRGKMSVYQTAETKRAREEEAKIAARVGEGKGKLQVDTAVKKIEGIERADETVKAESGLVKFREDKVLKIMDETLIPCEFLMLDEKKILATLKAGGKVLGAELEIKMVPLNYR